MWKKISKKINRLSILGKLILAFLLVFVVSTILGTRIAEQKVHTTLVSQIKEGNTDKLETSGLRVKDLVQSGTDVLLALRNNNELKEGLALNDGSPSGMLESIYKVNDILLEHSFLLMNIECKTALTADTGKVYATWEMINLDAIDKLKQEYKDFDRENNHRLALFRKMEHNLPLSSTESAGYNLTFILPITGENQGTEAGLLMLAIPQKFLQEYIKFDDDKLHDTFLVDENGMIISSDRLSEIGSSVDKITGRTLPDERKGSFHTKNGNESLITYNKIENLNWYIVDRMDNRYIENQVSKVETNMLIIIPISIVLGSIFMFLIARSITKPLNRLAVKMTNQDYMDQIREDRKYGSNEVMMLEESFDTMLGRMNELMVENLSKEREKRDTEVRALQSQIRPHFLFNTLNAIKCSIINEKKEKASDMIYSLIMLLHMTVVRGDEMIPLTMELETIGYYLELIKLRHGLDIKIISDIAPSLTDFKLPKLLLQPLVENSVLHGFIGKKEGWIIRVLARETEDEYSIEVCDNGVGFAHDADERKIKKLSFSGIGIENVIKRIRLYWGRESGLKIYRREDWTVALISLKKERYHLEDNDEGSTY